jgi:hypothetical protein
MFISIITALKDIDQMIRKINVLAAKIDLTLSGSNLNKIRTDIEGEALWAILDGIELEMEWRVGELLEYARTIGMEIEDDE